MKRFFSLALLLVGFSAFVSGQHSMPDSLEFFFHQQLSILPHEKIYLHTDKPYYLSGEKIWFRAWLVDAIHHIPSSVSRYVYVELINSLNAVVTRVKIQEEAEVYYGYLLIPDDATEGDYTLRAYTTYMRNQEEEYFFTKTLHIGTSESETQFAVVKDISENNFDVGFYPEGGSLMLGTPCKVAFKGVSSNGQATEVSGAVYNQFGTKIVSIKSDHLGMGGFVFAAQKGETYYAVCESDKGKSRRFTLPTAVDHGYAIAVNQGEDNVYVAVLEPSPSEQDVPLYLFAHTRGMVHFVDSWDFEKEWIAIPKALFPTGILHLILFDSHRTPLSERLIFIDRQDQAQTIFHFDREQYAARSLVKNCVALTDKEGEPLTGSFSVSVTSDREVAIDSTSDILTQLLLTSDLRGHVDNPAYYFQHTPESILSLDLLMLTQGWRRYNTAKWAQGQYQYPVFPLELNSKISGRVQNLSSGRPIKDIEVILSSVVNGFYYSVQSDNKGKFSLPTGDYPDKTRYVIGVDPKKGRINTELILDSETFPERTLSAFPPPRLNRSLFVQYVDMAEQQYEYEGGVRATQLAPAVVTAERIIPKRSDYYTPLSPHYTLTEEQIDEVHALSVFQLLDKLPGVWIQYSSPPVIHIARGPNTFSEGGAPLIMIDNQFVDISIEEIPVDDIAQIDILSSPAQTSIFGVRGMNGVISIFTKKGGDVHHSSPPEVNIKTLLPLGYQRYAEFYTPIYETDLQRSNGKPDLRTTIHWQPVVQIDNQGQAFFSFYTADEQTSYTVTIEGVADNGTIIRNIGKIYCGL